jgi:CRISPR-associated protein Csb2
MQERMAMENEVPATTQPIFAAARYSIESVEKLPIQEALPLAEQLRRAIIRQRLSTRHSDCLVGKSIDGSLLVGHTHAHYFSTDEDGDRTVDHLTVYAPRGLDEGDLEALKNVRSVALPWRPSRVRVLMLGIGGLLSFPTAMFRSSRRWRSITPFSLPRFANRGRGKPPRPRDLPEGQLRRELRLRGLPEPVSIKPLSGHVVPGQPIIPWATFHTTRHNGTRGNGLAGFEIEFAEPVRGPVALGFGCHFGLGLFLPVNSDITMATS